MNSQAVSKVSRTGDRTRTSCGSSRGLALGFAAAAGAALMVGALPASAGGTAWGVSVGVASGGSYIGGSYAQGYRGGYGGGGYGYRGGYAGGGYGYRGGAARYAGGGYCAPIARPYCAPIAAPYCAPVARPYYGGYARGYYPGFRPYCAPSYYAPAYLPPVAVAPVSTYYGDGSAISIGVGVAGSNGGGYFSYASAPAVTTVYPTATYATQVVAPAPVVYQAPANVTYVNPAPQQTIQYASQPAQPAPQQQAPVVQQPQQPSTAYHSSGAGGTMQRNASAATIIREMTASTGDARAQCAEMYLGKTPSQAWGVTFEGVQETGGVKEIRCRAVETLENGYSPTIIVRGAGDAKAPPQQMRGMVTGRVASITVDDPAYPGGLIVLDDSWVKW